MPVAQEGQQAGLVGHLPTGEILVRALDPDAHLLLSANRLRITVSYPLLIAVGPGPQEFTYMQHTQHFPALGFPQRWQPAYMLAIAAAGFSRALAMPGSAPQQPSPEPPGSNANPSLGPEHARPGTASSATFTNQHAQDLATAVATNAPSAALHSQMGMSSMDQQAGPAMHHTEDLASELSHWPDPGSPHLRHQSGMRGMDAWANSAERHGHNEHATLDSSALSSHPRSIDGDSFTQLPVSGSLEGDDAAGLAFAELPWWRSPSAVVTPHGPPVQVEQTPEAVYHCLPQHGQVHAWVRPWFGHVP